MSKKVWVQKNGQPLGPYSEEEVRQYIQSRQLDPQDLAAWEGDAAWTPLASLVALPPPPAAPPPTRQPVVQRAASAPVAKARAPSAGKPADSVEKQLFQANPSMFRNNPIGFIISIILVPVFGAGLILLLYWWLKVKGISLMVSNERITLRRGILSKHINEVFLSDIRNVQINQSFFQRIFGVATIAVSTAGQADVEIAVDGLRDPQKIKEIIDQHRRR
ncbi:MAG: PH domain-containing protein [Opitutales bacterium]|jgi:membrane protein YdbS with pleckstrin-like domain